MSATSPLASNNRFRAENTTKMQNAGSQDMPADYQDPNHPLAPVDIETQSLPKCSCTKNDKTLYTAAGVAVFVVGLVAAFLIGMKISHSRSSPSSNLENATNTTVEWHRINITTTVTSISTETPQPTTLTKWITITPIIFAPQSLFTSTSSPSTPESSTWDTEPSTSTIEPKIGTEKSEGKCLVVGSFGAKDICEYHCIPINEGKAQHCDVGNGRWLCIRCDTVQMNGVSGW